LIKYNSKLRLFSIVFLSSILLTSVAAAGMSQQAFAAAGDSTVTVLSLIPAGPFIEGIFLVEDLDGIAFIDIPGAFPPVSFSPSCVTPFTTPKVIALASSYPLEIVVEDCVNGFDKTHSIEAIAPVDDDGDGVFTPGGDEGTDDDPCVPSTANDACQKTLDDDNDGTNNFDDPDDVDVCIPEDDADACLKTLDSDGDGVNDFDDQNPTDPCQPNTLQTPQVCDLDGDGSLTDVDPDESNPCDPFPGSDACAIASAIDDDGDGVPEFLDDDDDDPCIQSSKLSINYSDNKEYN